MGQLFKIYQIHLIQAVFFASLLLTISVAQPYSASKTQSSLEVEKPDLDTPGESAGSQILTLDYQAVMPFVKLNLVHGLYLIFELTLLKEVDYEDYQDNAPTSHSFFKTLFRQIISPNGP